MGRQFHEQSDDVEFESYDHHNQGFMEAILNVLHYRHWYNVKKMFPYRKYNRGRRHLACCENPQTFSTDHFQVPQQTRKTDSTIKKSSNRASTKGLTSKKNHKKWILGFGFGWMNPIVVINRRTDISNMNSLSSWAETSRSNKPQIHNRMISGKHAKKLTEESDLHQTQYRTHLVMNQLKDYKQRIKQILKQVSIKDVNNKCRNEDGTDNGISNVGVDRRRRTKLINESLDRYTKLFEHSTSKEADLDHSKSIKFSNEYQVPFLRRISSSSVIDSLCSLLHTVSRDALSLNMGIDAHNEPKSINIHEGIDKFELVETVIEAELQLKMREGNNHDSSSLYLSMDANGEGIAKSCDLVMEKTTPHLEQESDFAVADNPSGELTISEGPGLNHPNLGEEETESSTFLRDKPTMLSESDDEADPYYNFVRDILELSGFLQNEGIHSWYSPHQPLNPSLFKELETVLHPELGHCSIDDDDRQLVFDLVNEALVEIGKKTCIYFPTTFDCLSSLMFKGNIVLEEVWREVSRNLSQLEHDLSSNDIVGRDLEKDAWMMIPGEADIVALELEDLVFDELLDELLCL